ncbi:hypothetical protein SLA2020_383660 [Shorea laevis]
MARQCYISIRRLSSYNLLPLPSTTQEPADLLTKLRFLSSRGHLQEALSLFYSAPSQFHYQQTYATLFHACAQQRQLNHGVKLHHFMLAHHPSCPHDIILTNHVINMFAKCGHLNFANQLFDEMLGRNVVSWTVLISGYAQCGMVEECFRLLSGMLGECRPNEYAFASVLSSCGYGQGKQVHALALKMAMDASVYVANALITMYGKSHEGGKVEALTVFESMQFQNLVSWNSMMAGFQLWKLGLDAVRLFTKMHRDGVGFDRATLLSVISSLCPRNSIAVESSLKLCLQMHCLALKSGFISEIEVATALVKAYSDLGGDVSDIYQLFLGLSSCQDIVLWTGMITAFAERDPVEAFFLFCQLLREDLDPDWYTFSSVLKACSGLVTEWCTLAVHSQVIKTGFDDDTVLNNALIHAYARCGSIALSKQVFDEMAFHDLVSWNSMLKAYGLHGLAGEALQLFLQMDVKPDPATFVALLSACSHSGLVEEGIKIFDSMSENHGIVPQLDHYACMVDILGRTGRIIEAKELINTMPMQPDSVIWSALLGSCRKYGETQLAKLASAKLKELDPENSLGYVQMSNIYCSGGSFGEAGLIRKEMEGSRVRKEPGLSWIEIGNKVHEFASGGRWHPQREAIFTRLKALVEQLREIGYVPDTTLALHDVEEEHKEEQLFHHSEKLALAFAIMNEGSLHCGGHVIRIMKNVRICVDCHNFMRLASHLLKKEIIVRDSNRFHHFKNRECSCRDYW